MHDLISAPGRVSVLGNPQNPGNVELPGSVGDALGKTIVSRHATRPDELDTAFAAAAVDGDQAMVVQVSPLSFEERWRVIGLAARFRLPTVYPLRDYVEGRAALVWCRATRQFRARRRTGRQDPTRRQPGRPAVRAADPFRTGGQFEDGRELGLTIPPAILDLANEVIE